MKQDFILTLYSRPETVFTLSELALLFPEIPYLNLKNKAYYFAKAGKLKYLRRGIYTKENFHIFELANKLYTPSYISLEAVLQKAGIIFQDYKSITVLSYLSRTVKVDNNTFIFRKIKNSILLNTAGIEDNGIYAIATKERAFLDAVFLYKDYHFDNLSPLDWTNVHELKNIYASRALEKRVNQYADYFKKTYA